MNDRQENDDFQEPEDVKSKSEVKREYKALQALGKELVELSPKLLVDVPISEAMQDMIATAKTLKHGTLNRQLRLIGRRMEEEDVDAIRVVLTKLKLPHKQKVEQFHEVENWRDQLLSGDSELFQTLADQYANFDRQYVNQLIRNAKKEQEQSKPPKSSRLLFQYLKDIHSEMK